MKKFILLISFCSSIFALTYGQYVPQYPLVEHFTNTRCVICPPLNGPYYQVMDAYEGFVHHLSYHPPVPYPQDTFYRANPIPQDTRRLHYGVTGTPKAYLNGIQVRTGSSLVPTDSIERYRGIRSGLDIQVDEFVSQGQMQLLIALRTLDSNLIPANGGFRLFVVLVEDSVYFEAGNGEKWHKNIFRDTLTSMEGLPFVPAVEGGGLPFTFAYNLKPEWDSSRVHALAFVFHDAEGFVNSGAAGNLRVNTSATASNNQNDATATANAQGGTPPYTYQWNDPDSQITASATGLNPGTYLVTVTDQAGTSLQEKVVVQTQVKNEALKGYQPFLTYSEGELMLNDFPLGEKSVKVWALDGKLMQQHTLKAEHTLSLSLQNGIYVVEVEGIWGTWRSKIWLR